MIALGLRLREVYLYKRAPVLEENNGYKMSSQLSFLFRKQSALMCRGLQNNTRQIVISNAIYSTHRQKSLIDASSFQSKEWCPEQS